MNPLFTPEAQALLNEMNRAGANLEQAKIRYQGVLATIRTRMEGGNGLLDRRENDIAILSFQDQGRVLATAITEYSTASMKWLVYVKNYVRPKARAAGE
jgi:hypothetical protein